MEGAQRPDPRTQLTPVGFEQRLLARARAVGFRRGDRVVVGFSGGRDSLALGSGLRRVRDVLGVELLLVHVDHRLRAGSGVDAERAATVAQRLGLAFRAHTLELSATEMYPHVGVEEAARRARYEVLVAAAREIGARAVATGHHEGDQAETVLLHLLRGSGVHGAAGMREWGTTPNPPPAGRDISPGIDGECASHVGTRTGDQPALWRPMLREPRSVIDAYVRVTGLPWVEDPSNADVSLRRNAIRHEVMPLLEANFPGATAALARFADLAAADDDALEQMAAAVLQSEVDPGGRLRAATLSGRHLAMQRRIVRGWLTHATNLRELPAERIDAVIELALSGHGGRTVEAGGGWTVRPRRGMLNVDWRGDVGGGES